MISYEQTCKSWSVNHIGGHGFWLISRPPVKIRSHAYGSFNNPKINFSFVKINRLLTRKSFQIVFIFKKIFPQWLINGKTVKHRRAYSSGTDRLFVKIFLKDTPLLKFSLLLVTSNQNNDGIGVTVTPSSLFSQWYTPRCN